MLNRTQSRRFSDFPLAWERLLWSGRPVWLGRLRRHEEYHFTDFRVVVRRSDRTVAIVDAQMRNAVYGYLAEGEKLDRAAYMRGVVMPGMARLLHRPPYDFTQSYGYNRARFAFGCYHCHLVSAPEQSLGPTPPTFAPQ